MKLKLITCSLALLGLLLVPAAAESEIVRSQRTALGGGIAHYTYDVMLGAGQFETIRLHRVVRERRPHRPVATITGLFMITGTQNTFEMIYLQRAISSAVPWDQSVAVYLAKNDIDVWGMDYAWALIPGNTSSFGFMDGWGMQRDIDSVEAGLAAARSIRIATGQGNRRLHLLGFSYGVPIAYALASEETQSPPGQRHVKGLVAVDFDMKLNNEGRRLAACRNAANLAGRIGELVNRDGEALKGLGTLAKFFPDAVTPISDFQPLTNWQVALFLGAIHLPWHFVGGDFNQFGIPQGLLYTEPDLWIDVMRAAPPFMPLGAILDVATTRCDQDDVPFDDHLRKIRLPILAIGAAGGAGPYHYTSSLTSSRDVDRFTVQLLPNAAVPIDFGHADLFTATNAEALVWQPLLDWLVDHRNDRANSRLLVKAGNVRLGSSELRAPVVSDREQIRRRPARSSATDRRMRR